MDQPQRAALCHARIACGLFTLIVVLPSIIRAAAFGLPAIQRVACHTSSAAPSDKAPNCFFILGSFASLHSSRSHNLQLIPCPWAAHGNPYCLKEVVSIITKSDVGTNTSLLLVLLSTVKPALWRNWKRLPLTKYGFKSTNIRDRIHPRTIRSMPYTSVL